MNARDYITAVWLGYGLSAALFGWQLMAFLTGSAPNHLLPVVRLFFGPEHAVPIAYALSVKIGIFSGLGCVACLLVILGDHLIARRTGERH